MHAEMLYSSNWRVLDLRNEKLPKLLLKYRFDSSGYQIELTDLSRIWREQLIKDDILQRASEVGSSIDPSQDDEQFNLFLGKIQSALLQEEYTSVTFVGGRTGDKDLSLQLSARLPHPLPQFRWTVHLQLLPAEQLEVQLVSPLLLQACNLHHQIEQLVSQIQDKDRVISKICDRLETSGNDLTAVFPGVSNIKTSRKKGQREQLAKHVKGLSDFDETAWKKQHAGDGHVGQLDKARIGEALQALPLAIYSHDVHTSYDEWWRHFGEKSGFEASQPHQTGDVQGGKSHKNAKDVGDSMQDGEFQTQSTPPHLRKPSAQVNGEVDHATQEVQKAHDEPTGAADSVMANDNDSTTDEEDEDDLDTGRWKSSPTQRQKSATPINQRNASASPSVKKLGTIGGGSNQALLSPAKGPIPEERLPDPAPAPRPKLGTIGGRAKSVAPFSTDQEAGQSTSPPREASKMGVIGGRKAKESGSSEVTIEEPAPEPRLEPLGTTRHSRTPAKEETPAPRETSQERADRKRDQLKRELEEKSKGPAKKKRKF